MTTHSRQTFNTTCLSASALSPLLHSLEGSKGLWTIRFTNLRYSLTSFLLIYLFLAALGFRCCVQAFSSCGEQGLLFAAVFGLLIAVASLVAEHRL